MFDFPSQFPFSHSMILPPQTSYEGMLSKPHYQPIVFSVQPNYEDSDTAKKYVKLGQNSQIGGGGVRHLGIYTKFFRLFVERAFRKPKVPFLHDFSSIFIFPHCRLPTTAKSVGLSRSSDPLSRGLPCKSSLSSL